MEREKDFKKYISPIKLRNFCIGYGIFTIIMGLVQPVLFIAFGVYEIIFLLIWFVGYSKRKSKINELKHSGELEHILCDFKNANVILNDKVRVGEDYIYFKHVGKALKYTEVLWIYRFVQRYLFIPISSMAMIGDNTGKVKGLCTLKSSKVGETQIKELMTIVYEKNPKVLLGYALENQKQYRQLVKRK